MGVIGERAQLARTNSAGLTGNRAPHHLFLRAPLSFAEGLL